jgi:hypothetical protein
MNHSYSRNYDGSGKIRRITWSAAGDSVKISQAHVRVAKNIVCAMVLALYFGLNSKNSVYGCFEWVGSRGHVYIAGLIFEFLDRLRLFPCRAITIEFLPEDCDLR